jgi:hypothetical protein
MKRAKPLNSTMEQPPLPFIRPPPPPIVTCRPYANPDTDKQNEVFVCLQVRR